MMTFNETISIEEARQLINAKSMSYLPTPHNRNMIKKAMDEVLERLRSGK